MIEKDILVVGAGPAGLSASIEAGKTGADVLLVDMNLKPGGQLFKQIHKFFGSSVHHSGTRGYEIGTMLLEQARENKVEIWMQSTVIGVFEDRIVAVEKALENGEKKLIKVQAKKIIIATGASENTIRFDGWTTPGVMGAGAAQTMVNVNHVKPGKRVVMLGSGNVGLIVSYQLMQAGCEVVALVEAAPKIGGYAVHAAKIRRAGVPIYLKHTIQSIEKGPDGCVSGVTIVAVDDKFEMIPGSEQKFACDTVTLAVGLRPVTDIMKLSSCKLSFHPAFGGWIPMHNDKMETTQPDIYVAGDATGVEEANTALEEGKIAGISASEALGLISQEEAKAGRELVWQRLESLRKGPFGEKRKTEKDNVIQEYLNLELGERKSSPCESCRA